MEFKPLNFKFVIFYVAVVIVLLSIDVYSFSFGYSSVFSIGIFSIIFFLILSILLTASYVASSIKTKEGGRFHTTKLFFIPLIIIYGEIGLWAYIVLFFLSQLIVERKEKLFVTYGCSKEYMSGFAFSHLFMFLNKDQPINFNSGFLILYFSISIISYLVDIADDYAYRRVHLIDPSELKIWSNIIEIRRAVIPNYLLSVFLAGIIILLFHSNDFRYLALALPIIISAVAIYRRFYAIYVEDRATEIEGEV